jgi:alpha-2-macroglobulin-like protein
MKNTILSGAPAQKPTKNHHRFLMTLLICFTFFLMAFILPVDLFTEIKDNEFLKEIREKTTRQSAVAKEERVFLHLDRPMYEPGDNIWFAAYLQDAVSMKSGSNSEILNVEMLDPKGAVVKSYSLILKEGKAAGDFTISEDAPGGIYKIRAFTNWMKNKAENNCFEREIQVQKVVLPRIKMKLDFERKAFGPGDEVMAKLQLMSNENKPLALQNVKFVGQINGEKILEKNEKTGSDGVVYVRFKLPTKLSTTDGLLNALIPYEGNTESVSRSIPIVLNKLSLEFFPEGGDLVSGLTSKIAFRARNEFGKPADVEGEVFTSSGKKVAHFSSLHQGMGSFQLMPVQGENYSVKITQPEGINQTYSLPSCAERGYVLGLDNTRKENLEVEILTTENEELSLVIQMRGKVYYTNAINAIKGKNEVFLSTAQMPAGVAQVTLFDSKQIARCERLVFLNKERQLNIDLQTEKEKYLPREKVKLHISVKDERGFSVPANLSLAVVNDQFLSFADDKNGNILSQLLLEQDLKEKVEEPSFYFNTTEPRSDLALDHLLLTSGWRHFTWQQIVKNDFPEPSFQVEKATISGVIYDGMTRKSIPFAKIKTKNGKEFKADTNGRFSIRHQDLYEPLSLNFQAPNYTEQQQLIYEYNNSLSVYLYDKSYLQTRGNRFFDEEKEALVPGVAEGGVLDMMVREDVQLMEVAVVEKKKNALHRNNRKEELANDKVNNKNEPDANQQGFDVEKMDTIVFRNLGRAAFIDNNQRAVKYYRARKFPAKTYKQEETITRRTDFPNTLYWNPEVEIGKSGKTTVEFFAADDVTSYRVVAEGVGYDGNLGHQEKNIYTQLPFQLTTKLPEEAVFEDKVSIPVTLKNNTTKPLGGELKIQVSPSLKQLTTFSEAQTIMPGEAKTLFMDFLVVSGSSEAEISVAFNACGLSDQISRKIKIVSKGYPQQLSFSAQEREKSYSFFLTQPVTGSLKINVTAYPNVVSDLLKGIEGILREPGGCFEQTSMSSYPNAMVLDYLRSTDNKDEKLLASATSLMDRGYNRLVTFETKEKGYEWFGSNPGHEALTAYGLMQFSDIKRVGGKVSETMMNRTAEWLLARRDHKGGFSRNDRALDNFGRASEAVTNAYIVYALSEAGYTDIKKEFEVAFAHAMKSSDTYELALMCNAAFNLNETEKGKQSLALLLKKQKENGSFEGAHHSITYSQGHSLIIETTALATMAMMKSDVKEQLSLNNGIKWIVSARDGYGAFGNTQGTVLALKALTTYAKMSKKVNEDGSIVVWMDGKQVARENYKAGEKDAIVLSGMEQFVKQEGEHEIKVRFENKESVLPYSISVSWNTNSPKAQSDCAVSLFAKTLQSTVKVGETLRLSAVVTNQQKTGIPSTMVVLGIPAGFSVQPWQLKELQDKKVFDFYEIIGNKLAIYYRCMAPSDSKEINLDLKAEIPGVYEAPCSAAYLYYTNEMKSWSGLGKITIIKNNG